MWTHSAIYMIQKDLEYDGHAILLQRLGGQENYTIYHVYLNKFQVHIFLKHNISVVEHFTNSPSIKIQIKQK